MGTVDLLFVYGSLLRGQPAEGYLSHLPVAEATCQGVLYRTRRAYPALVADPQGVRISGEVVRFSDAGFLPVLDLYEDTRSGLFTRLRIPIHVRGRDLQAWAYTVTHAQARQRGYRRLQATDWRTVAPRRSP